MEHKEFDKTAFSVAVQALVDECHADGVDIRNLGWFMTEAARDFLQMGNAPKLSVTCCWAMDKLGFPGCQGHSVNVTSLRSISS